MQKEIKLRITRVMAVDYEVPVIIEDGDEWNKGGFDFIETALNADKFAFELKFINDYAKDPGLCDICDWIEKEWAI